MLKIPPGAGKMSMQTTVVAARDGCAHGSMQACRSWLCLDALFAVSFFFLGEHDGQETPHRAAAGCPPHCRNHTLLRQESLPRGWSPSRSFHETDTEGRLRSGDGCFPEGSHGPFSKGDPHGHQARHGHCSHPSTFRGSYHLTHRAGLFGRQTPRRGRIRCRYPRRPLETGFHDERDGLGSDHRPPRRPLRRASGHQGPSCAQRRGCLLALFRRRSQASARRPFCRPAEFRHLSCNLRGYKQGHSHIQAGLCREGQG